MTTFTKQNMWFKKELWCLALDVTWIINAKVEQLVYLSVHKWFSFYFCNFPHGLNVVRHVAKVQSSLKGQMRSSFCCQLVFINDFPNTLIHLFFSFFLALLRTCCLKCDCKAGKFGDTLGKCPNHLVPCFSMYSMFEVVPTFCWTSLFIILFFHITPFSVSNSLNMLHSITCELQ